MEPSPQEAAEELRKKRSQRNRELWADPEYRRKKSELNKIWRAKNKERLRLRESERYRNNKEAEDKKRVERYHKNRERERIRQNEWYAKNKSTAAPKYNLARTKREPWRGLTRAANDYKFGRITFDEFVNRYRDALARLNERASRGLKPNRKENI